MNLNLIRQIFTDECTLGELFIDNEHFCYTCEDVVRSKKIAGETAIPSGKYRVILTWSNRFNKVLPLLANVPNYTGVRIHAGNSAKDTEGCILVGLTHNANSVMQSRDAMAALMPKLNDAFHKNEDVTIEVA